MKRVIDVGTTKVSHRLVFAGRINGFAVRDEFEIDKVVKSGEQVVISFPGTAYTVSRTFFEGMFGEAIRQHNSKEKFFEQFEFKVPDFLKPVLDEYSKDYLRRLHYTQKPIQEIVDELLASQDKDK